MIGSRIYIHISAVTVAIHLAIHLLSGCLLSQEKACKGLCS